MGLINGWAGNDVCVERGGLALLLTPPKAVHLERCF